MLISLILYELSYTIPILQMRKLMPWEAQIPLHQTLGGRIRVQEQVFPAPAALLLPLSHSREKENTLNRSRYHLFEWLSPICSLSSKMMVLEYFDQSKLCWLCVGTVEGHNIMGDPVGQILLLRLKYDTDIKALELQMAHNSLRTKIVEEGFGKCLIFYHRHYQW